MLRSATTISNQTTAANSFSNAPGPTAAVPVKHGILDSKLLAPGPTGGCVWGPFVELAGAVRGVSGK